MLLEKIWTSEALPLDVEEVKLDLRVDSSDDDGTIERLIRAAADFAEIRTGLVFNAGRYQAVFDDFEAAYCTGPREIFRAPIREVEGSTYLSAANTWTDLDLADFQISKRAKSFVIYPLTTFDVPTTFTCLDALKVTFLAGFDPADADTNLDGTSFPLPGGLKTMLTMLVGHYYKNRELFDADKTAEIEVGAGSLIGAYRQFW